MTKKKLYTKRVNKGIKWLNKYYPGWFRKIKISELQMASGLTCICGQLYGQFSNIYKEGFSGLETVSHGFYLSIIIRDDSDYLLLTDIWTEKIKKLIKKK